MKESVTYQKVIREGKVEGIREILIRMGKKCFGQPDAAARRALNSITELKQLEALSDRILEAESWDELLAQ